MAIRWLTAFIDRPAAAFDDAVRFWLAVTGATLSASRGDRGEFATLVPADGDACLRVQRLPDGPGGSHLDVHVDDIPAAAARALALGASEITATDDVVVLGSPAGLPFCLVRHRGESRRPSPVAPPGTVRHTLVDQLCVDVPHGAHDREQEFWSTFTGWGTTSTRRPEFAAVLRPPEMPLRLLIQRLDVDDGGQRARAHLDLACEDADAAATAHRALGARVLAHHRDWITLADPAGVAYCLTRRHPDTGHLRDHAT